MSDCSSSVSASALLRGRTVYSPVSQIKSEPVAWEADSMRLFCEAAVSLEVGVSEGQLCGKVKKGCT